MTLHDVLQWKGDQGLWKRRGLSQSTVYQFILYFCLTPTRMAIAGHTETLDRLQFKM